MQMKKIIDVTKNHFSRIEGGDCSRTEVILTGLCLLLSGVILGMKFAPARVSTFGSFNGNQGSIDKPEDIKKALENK